MTTAYQQAKLKIDSAYRNNEEELNLANLGLTRLPPNIGKLRNLKALDLEGNRLKRVPEECGELENLEHLDFSSNDLQEVPIQICRLSKLQFLNLSGNRLKQLPREFGRLRSLRRLYLNDNALVIVSGEIASLHSLEELRLMNNRLETFDLEIFNLKNLKILDLMSNQLNRLPPQIGQLTSLITLDLMSNKLTQIPEEIAHLKSVENLDLAQNRLSDLPDAIGSLTTLKNLRISSNFFNKIPEPIFKLESLVHLDVSYCGIDDIPYSLKNLKNLTNIYASGNVFRNFPLVLTEMHWLRDLSLRYAGFSSVPSEISNLKQLTTLSLSNNGLRNFPAALTELNSLKSLELSGNEIETLPRRVSKLQNLETLNLDFNRLADLPAALTGMASLKALDLQHNKLKTLPSGFRKIPLRRLDLRDNDFDQLPRELGFLTSLETAAENDYEPYTEGLWVDEKVLPYKELRDAAQPQATSLILSWLRGEITFVEDGQVAEAVDAASPPAIPPQGHGPHFDIGEDGIVRFARPDALDAEGNNVSRLRRLHPPLRSLSEQLIEHLGKGNIPHWHLRERAEEYLRMISKELEDVDFSLLYVEGIRLANSLSSIQNDNELPSLDVQTTEILNTLLQVHGTFILSTVDGIESIAAEDRYRRSAAEEREFRSAATVFAETLQDQPEIIDPAAAQLILGTTREIGRGADPVRSGTVGAGVIRNVAIAISAAATIAALPAAAIATGSYPFILASATTGFVAAEGLKKSKPFAVVATLISTGLDKVAEADMKAALKAVREKLKPQFDFVLRAEPQLRKLAKDKDEYIWLNSVLDWLSEGSRSSGRDIGQGD